jgi:hypothetical protein
MSAFVFRSDRGEDVSAAKWLEIWASKFDNEKYPEDAYKELVASGLELSDADFDVLGAWKDGGLKISTPNGGRRFGNCWVSFTGRWSATAASCAYTVWRNLPIDRSVLERYLSQGEHREFLVDLAERSYLKASKGRPAKAAFGLSRATYVLHVFSQAEFPIYDKNTHRGVYSLTEGRYGSETIWRTKTDDPVWYLGTFCRIVRDLEVACMASRRAVDQALFCYGKSQK